MEEDKTKALLDEYRSKSNVNMQEILDEKINKMEDILKREINELRTTVQDIDYYYYFFISLRLKIYIKTIPMYKFTI